MPTIERESAVVTHINVFAVPHDRQEALVESLIDTVNAAREVRGWISASIHRSYDGTQVVNYVQFASHEVEVA
jgi:hypothetical protein